MSDHKKVYETDNVIGYDAYRDDIYVTDTEEQIRDKVRLYIHSSLALLAQSLEEHYDGGSERPPGFAPHANFCIGVEVPRGGDTQNITATEASEQATARNKIHPTLMKAFKIAVEEVPKLGAVLVDTDSYALRENCHGHASLAFRLVITSEEWAPLVAETIADHCREQVEEDNPIEGWSVPGQGYLQ